jgi:hypothetical protein
LSGKIAIGLVTAAVSSASAATVGVVYTKIVYTNNIDVASVAELAPSTPKTAVVLNAKEGYFDSVQDSSSSDADAPVCPGAEDSQRCVVVARASDVHLKILGYTLSLPPIWLGGDSQDAVPANADGLPSLFDELPSGLEVVVHLRRRHVLPSDQSPGPQEDSGTGGPQSQNGPTTNKTSGTNSVGDATGGRTDSQLTEFEVLTSPLSTGMLPQSNFSSDFSGQSVDPLAALFPLVSPTAGGQTPQTFAENSTPDGSATQTLAAVPSYQSPVPVIPEASTWTMTIAGFAALGFFKRRRIAAAFWSVKG